MIYFNYTYTITHVQYIDKNNLKLLGKHIKTLREKQSKSLNKFVLNQTNLTTATWSRIENGKVDVKFCTILKVAGALNITVDELLKDLPFAYITDEE